MGQGDALIAAGLAEIEYRRDILRGPVTIVSPDGRPRWHPLWAGNPAIHASDDPSLPRVTCGSGCLPYLLPKQPGRLVFNPAYRAADSARARIYLTSSERALARERVADLHGQPFILIEPFPTDRLNVNRQWPLQAWKDLVLLLRSWPGMPPVVQFVHDYATRLDVDHRLWSPTFRDACALMEHASCLVCLEGGLPFAAAALNTPAVVLWGGAVSANVLAYPEHTNLVGPHNGHGCKKPCAACADAWQSIDPAAVAAAVWGQLQRSRRTQAAMVGAAI